MEDFFEFRDGAKMFYRVDDFSDPWKPPSNVLLIHGFGESSEVWRAWTPHLARYHRVFRIDRRGFGRSTPMPENFAWDFDDLVAELAAFIETVVGGSAHVVAAKIGTTLAIRLSVERPDLVQSLSIVGGTVKGPQGGPWSDHIKRFGVRHWAEATMDNRVGPEMSDAEKRWWIELTSRSPASTMIGFLRYVHNIDVTKDLPRVKTPTLVMSSDSTRFPRATVTAWQQMIPGSRYVAVAGNGYHIAAAYPDLCATTVREFIEGK